MASLTDPLGKKKGSTGNGIAVYGFESGRVAAERFLPLAPRTNIPAGKKRRVELKDVTYPAGLCVGQERRRRTLAGGEQQFRRGRSAECGRRENHLSFRSFDVQANPSVAAVYDGDDQRREARICFAVERFVGCGAGFGERARASDDSAAQARDNAGRRVASDGAAAQSQRNHGCMWR